jgi:uncharacterized protein YpmB
MINIPFIALILSTLTFCGQQQHSTKNSNQQNENIKTETVDLSNTTNEDLVKPEKRIKAMQAENTQDIRAQFSDKAPQAMMLIV